MQLGSGTPASAYVTLSLHPYLMTHHCYILAQMEPSSVLALVYKLLAPYN